MSAAASFHERHPALHLLLQNTEGLVDIVVADKYLHLKFLAGLRMRKSCMQPIAQESLGDCDDGSDGVLFRQPRTRRSMRHGNPVRYSTVTTVSRVVNG